MGTAGFGGNFGHLGKMPYLRKNWQTLSFVSSVTNLGSALVQYCMKCRVILDRAINGPGSRYPGPRLNIKTVFPGIGLHYKDETIVIPSYLYNEIPVRVRRHLYIETPPPPPYMTLVQDPLAYIYIVW